MGLLSLILYTYYRSQVGASCGGRRAESRPQSRGGAQEHHTDSAHADKSFLGLWVIERMCAFLSFLWHQFVSNQ